MSKMNKSDTNSMRNEQRLMKKRKDVKKLKNIEFLRSSMSSRRKKKKEKKNSIKQFYIVTKNTKN
jgi:hypothetical protein